MRFLSNRQVLRGIIAASLAISSATLSWASPSLQCTRLDQACFVNDQTIEPFRVSQDGRLNDCWIGSSDRWLTFDVDREIRECEQAELQNRRRQAVSEFLNVQLANRMTASWIEGMRFMTVGIASYTSWQHRVYQGIHEKARQIAIRSGSLSEGLAEDGTTEPINTYASLSDIHGNIFVYVLDKQEVAPENSDPNYVRESCFADATAASMRRHGDCEYGTYVHDEPTPSRQLPEWSPSDRNFEPLASLEQQTALEDEFQERPPCLDSDILSSSEEALIEELIQRTLEESRPAGVQGATIQTAESSQIDLNSNSSVDPMGIGHCELPESEPISSPLDWQMLQVGIASFGEPWYSELAWQWDTFAKSSLAHEVRELAAFEAPSLSPPANDSQALSESSSSAGAGLAGRSLIDKWVEPSWDIQHWDLRSRGVVPYQLGDWTADAIRSDTGIVASPLQRSLSELQSFAVPRINEVGSAWVVKNRLWIPRDVESEILVTDGDTTSEEWISTAFSQLVDLARTKYRYWEPRFEEATNRSKRLLSLQLKQAGNWLIHSADRLEGVESSVGIAGRSTNTR